jgi:hypothetical protein
VNHPSFGAGSDPTEGGALSAPKTYPPEVGDRAVRPVDDLLADDQLQLSVSAADNLTAVPLPGRVSCNLLTLRAGYNVCSVAIFG